MAARHRVQARHPEPDEIIRAIFREQSPPLDARGVEPSKQPRNLSYSRKLSCP